MSLQQHITSDLKEAMKAGNEVAKSTLRMLQAEFMRREIELKRKGEGLPEDDATAVLGREIKKRKEAIAAYEKGGRPELVAREQEELIILEHYAPAQMNDEELEAAVRHAITEGAATGLQDMGKAMQKVMGAVRGKADGARVRAVVEKILQS